MEIHAEIKILHVFLPFRSMPKVPWVIVSILGTNALKQPLPRHIDFFAPKQIQSSRVYIVALYSTHQLYTHCDMTKFL